MTNINIRIDETVKDQAEAVLSELGMSTTTAITIFLKQVIRYRGIPFELRADPYTAYIEKALDEADEEAKHPGPRISHEEFQRKSRALLDELSH